MDSKNKLLKFGLPLVLLFLCGYFFIQSADRPRQDRDVFFEYSPKCNLWEVRDVESSKMLSRVTEGIKQLYELTGTKYSPLIKIDDKIVGYELDGVMQWDQPFSYNWIDGDEAQEIYGKEARYGLAEFTYNTEVIGEFKACTSSAPGDNLLGLPLVLYEGTLSKKPTNSLEERKYNGLEFLHGQPAVRAYGERAEQRPVYNHYITDAVSEAKNNDKTLTIDNSPNGKIVIEYSSDRIGDIDVLINQEFEQLVTSRHKKPEQSIRLELDPADWPPNNFTISVFKAGTDYGIETRLHRLENGKIEIDFDTEEKNRQEYQHDNKEIEQKGGEQFITVPGGQLALPEQLYRSINYIVNSIPFKLADAEYIAYWHKNLLGRTEEITYKAYITQRFKEAASGYGFGVEYTDESLSISSGDQAINDLVVQDWLHPSKVPARLYELLHSDLPEKDLPLMIIDHQEVDMERLKMMLGVPPLRIGRLKDIDPEVAMQRFGESGRNGVISMQEIKLLDL